MAVEKSKDRLEVLARIDEYERKRWWQKDVENDPPSPPLEPHMVDYLEHKLTSKIKSYFVTKYAFNFIQKLKKSKAIIIKDIIGFDNFLKLKDSGVVMTSNHFNAFETLALHDVFLPTIEKWHQKFYKVIREGNFTNFPGMYGLFFRHCYTLPLSSRMSTMKLFMKAVDKVLQKKYKLLVYAEQAMWWNYRKPRPVTSGAYKFAATNNVPVLPCFVTMTDSDIIGPDGFAVQEYTVHILEPIYPDANKSIKENVEYLSNKNYEMWKEVYEKFYGIPLEYLPEEK